MQQQSPLSAVCSANYIGIAMPSTAFFRFYEELNDFLPPHRRGKRFEYRFDGNPSVKDAVEALGVPHTEIDLIVVSGASVGFDHRLENGDAAAVYPLFESLDISPVVKLRPALLRKPSFICDVHLGALARLLRLAGFDTLYKNDYADEEIVEAAVSHQRCVLTRDRGILKRKAVTRGYCVRSTRPREQAREVVRRFDLGPAMMPFSRCMLCNGAMERASAESVLALVPPKTKECYREFHRCASCGKVYWQGSHFGKLKSIVDDLTKDHPPGD
ncbi:MAG TPA: Mut7-C RNAse domain-containing protein [Chitinivibrionales bacterium]|nr:Mut7-C RNAse domain-containing protein [Chitinivibrionales bacterium]